MGIISRKLLRDFWERYPNAEKPLRAWFADTKQAHWKSPTAIKNIYKNASTKNPRGKPRGIFIPNRFRLREQARADGDLRGASAHSP